MAFLIYRRHAADAKLRSKRNLVGLRQKLIILGASKKLNIVEK